MGSLYKRGNTWWIKYYRNGKSYRESSGTTKKMVAKKLLDRREGDIAQGKIPGIQFEKVFFDDLAEDFLRDYRINQRKSLVRAERSVNHLKKEFEGVKALSITTPRIQQYIEDRLTAKAAEASVNRELSALKRILNLGARQTPPLVDRVPYIPMLKENNVRTGFFEHQEFLKFRKNCSGYLEGFVTYAYKFGWRFDEIASLTWAQIDRDRWTVRLEVGTTKNDAGREVPLDVELKGVFQRQWEQRKLLKKLVPFVFPNRRGEGKIRDIRAAWKKAFTDSKVPFRLFHDLRRTAIRNMVRSGIPEKVAMRISGHKTRSVFERYNIVDDKDLEIAAKRQEKYLDSLTGTVSGTVHQFPQKKGVNHSG